MVQQFKVYKNFIQLAIRKSQHSEKMVNFIKNSFYFETVLNNNDNDKIDLLNWYLA